MVSLNLLDPLQPLYEFYVELYCEQFSLQIVTNEWSLGNNVLLFSILYSMNRIIY